MRKPFKPEFDNPYPDGSWQTISDVAYLSMLHLERDIDSVQMARGRDADYIVGQDYTIRFRLDGQERRISVPAGMLTDLASVPRLARTIVDRVGPHLEAAIVHDFLYIAWQDLAGRGARDDDRRFADELFLALMKAAEVKPFKRFIIYRAVKWFGSGAYERGDDPRYVRHEPTSPPVA